MMNNLPYMAGAMAGSMAKNVPREIGFGTHTLVMTINNLCNLECGHCYLQYEGEGSQYISKELLDIVVKSSVKHLVIAGKEPFVNDKSAEITGSLIEKAHANGKTVSIISNGINIPKYMDKNFPRSAFVDISLDGGPNSYPITRHNKTDKNFYQRAIDGAKRVLDLGIPLNILHAIHSKNIGFIDDLMTPILGLEGLNMAFFSQYVVTENDGTNDVSWLSIEKIMDVLSKTKEFMRHEKSHLFLDSFTTPGIEENVEELSNMYRINGKVMIATRNQIAQIMRLTYDGLVTTPQDSIHTALYPQIGHKFDPMTQDFDEVLETIREKNVKKIFNAQLKNHKQIRRSKWGE